MHTINVTFDDHEFGMLQKLKGTRSWREFILDAVAGKLSEGDVSIWERIEKLEEDILNIKRHTGYFSRTTKNDTFEMYREKISGDPTLPKLSTNLPPLMENVAQQILSSLTNFDDKNKDKILDVVQKKIKNKE